VAQLLAAGQSVTVLGDSLIIRGRGARDSRDQAAAWFTVREFGPHQLEAERCSGCRASLINVDRQHRRGVDAVVV
jgi:hypothetical protein